MNIIQPSGAGFSAVDKIMADLTDRRGLRQAWDDIDEDIQAKIKYAWALIITDDALRHKVPVSLEKCWLALYEKKHFQGSQADAKILAKAVLDASGVKYE